MKKGFQTSFLLVLAVILLLPNYAQATESIGGDNTIDFNTSEKSLKIQSHKKGQQELKEQISTDTLVVKYNKRLPNAVHHRAGATVVKSIPALGFDVVKLKKGRKLNTAIHYYANTNNVVSVQPSMKYKKLGGQGDPKKNSMYHLSLLNIDRALELAGNHPVTVAVIDTGIDKNHPELKSQILPPYNAANPAAGQALDIHGTHVAGIIGAAMNNGIGGHGVSPNAKILPIDVFNGGWGASDYVLAEAIMYAIEKDADVINMSLGGYFESAIFKEAVQQAIDAGITVVTAAGNEATDMYSIPASYDGVISVGSIDKSKKLAFDSNYGPSVNLVAPGVDVYSTIFNPLKGSSFMEASGTSMASPIVAGVAALIKAKYPNLLPHEVQALLEHTATDLGEKGYDHTFGHGLVNPVAALTYELDKLPQRAEKIPENQMLKNAKVLPAIGESETTETFTKPGEAHYYQILIEKGEKLQTILSGSHLYDYQYELTYFPKKEKSHEPILVNNVKAGGVEGYLFEAETDGTLLIKVHDTNGNYSLSGKSEYTFTAEKLSQLLLDDSSIDNMIPIEIPYKSSEDNEGPFTLLSENNEVADYDYFTFSVQEELLVSIHLAALPGVDTSLAVYDGEVFDKDVDLEIEKELVEEGNWIAMAGKNGIGSAEKLVFEALPGIEYVLEVAGEPQFGDLDTFDFLLGFFDADEAQVGRSSQPYELMIEKVVLPPDEDGLPNDDFLGDFDEDWLEEEEKEQEEEEQEQEERMFEKFEVDKLLEHAVLFKIGAKQQGYFQFDEDEDYYQFTPSEDAIYEVNMKQGGSQSPYVTLYEYDETTHDLLPIIELFSFLDEKAALKGAVALQANKQYVLQILNFEGISIEPYTLHVERIKNVPVEKSNNKSKPNFAQEMQRGEIYEDYFIYGFEQYYYYKNEDESQIFTVHALPKKVTKEVQSQLPAALNNELVVGMAIIEDTNGNKKLDKEEYNKSLEFYPNIFDPSFTVNGSFKAKKDVGYFIVLVNFSEGLSLQQLTLQLQDTNRKDEDNDSIVTKNIPSKPLLLKAVKDELVGKGYFNVGIPFGDKDYYVFNVKNNGEATLTLKAGPGLDGIMKVYDEKGALVDNFDYYGVGDDEIGTLTVSEGKYYVEVSEAANTPSVTPYELSILLKPDPIRFIDMDKNNSHYEGIMYWTQKGVINGYAKANGSREFKPGLTISRAHTAVLFTKALDLPVPNDVPAVLNNFLDVSSNHLYANEIAATYQSNIFVGSNNLFKGNDALTREQMATILVRAYGLVDNGKKVTADLSNVSPSHKENVEILIQHNITNQTTDFQPGDFVTRGQFSTFLYRTEKTTNKY